MTVNRVWRFLFYRARPRLCHWGMHNREYFRSPNSPYDWRKCRRCGEMQRKASRLVDMGRDKVYWWETVED